MSNNQSNGITLEHKTVKQWGVTREFWELWERHENQAPIYQGCIRKGSKDFTLENSKGKVMLSSTFDDCKTTVLHTTWWQTEPEGVADA